MSGETVLFKSQERKSRQEIAQSLRLVADKLEHGNLQLRAGSQELSLDFPETMSLEIKVEEELKTRPKRSLELELEWYPDDSEGGGTIIA